MIINLKSQTDLSGFYVIYNGSTNLEKPGWYGISHLMEHLVCKSFEHLQDDFDRDGITWNAYTSSNEIVFYLTGLEEKVSKWKNDFLDLLSKFDVNKKQFENEKKIVLEEYSDYFNDQCNSHYLNLSRKLFNYYGPIGLKEDLERLRFMDCLNFFELQFLNPSKIINISKKEYKNNIIDFNKYDSISNKVYGNNKVPLEINNKYEDKTSLIFLSPIVNEDFAYITFINSMLSMGLNSPFYQEIREKKGLVYYIMCHQSRYNEQGIINISTQTSNNNTNKVIDLVKKVIKSPDKYLTKERLSIIKDYYKVRMKKQEILRYNNVDKFIEPEGWCVYDILDKVNMKKILDVYNKYYSFDNFYISNDKKEFKN
jgi:predicted Zn-dependent peptidase